MIVELLSFDAFVTLVDVDATESMDGLTARGKERDAAIDTLAASLLEPDRPSSSDVSPLLLDRPLCVLPDLEDLP